MENHGGMIQTGKTSDSSSNSHLVEKQEGLAKEMYLTYEICHISRGSLTFYKILRHGADGFTSPPNEGVLRIFIALTNPSSSAAFEPTKLGSNDKHANHFITEDYLINHT
jgi:hypothetical protein